MLKADLEDIKKLPSISPYVRNLTDILKNNQKPKQRSCNDGGFCRVRKNSNKIDNVNYLYKVETSYTIYIIVAKNKSEAKKNLRNEMSGDDEANYFVKIEKIGIADSRFNCGYVIMNIWKN